MVQCNIQITLLFPATSYFLLQSKLCFAKLIWLPKVKASPRVNTTKFYFWYLKIVLLAIPWAFGNLTGYRCCLKLTKDRTKSQNNNNQKKEKKLQESSSVPWVKVLCYTHPPSNCVCAPYVVLQLWLSGVQSCTCARLRGNKIEAWKS